ncbi:MAG: hypothetical protein PHW24_00425 [Candidatus Moranbacteria bacterium]|nr:hypothetical protein [Candidatus Moranbacteria bacterium]
MGSLKFKVGGTAVFNKKVILDELRMVDLRSWIALYTSQTLLLLGILLILFNNFDIVEPGNYFGTTLNWLTISVFFIGLLINFIFIPFLYFSSFNNFKRDIDFWDRETFWILPLFFFGTFFLYNSQVSMVIALVILSIMVIMFVHVKFFLEARKIFLQNVETSLDCHGQYFLTLKYLSAYYLILLVSLIFYNPFQNLFDWINFK